MLSFLSLTNAVRLLFIRSSGYLFFSLCNAIRLIFIKVLGFARDPSISDFAWCFAVI